MKKNAKARPTEDSELTQTKVTLYFDEEDVMVSEATYKKALSLGVNNRIHSVRVNYGDDKGQNQITKDIFRSKEKTKNAQTFLENYEKNKKHH